MGSPKATRGAARSGCGTMRAVRQTVGRAGQRVVGAVMLIGGLAMVIVPRPVITPMDHRVIVATCVVAVLLALLVPVPGRLRTVLASRWSGPLLALAGGGVGLFIGQVLHYHFGWDANVVMSLARRIQAGLPLTRGDYRYLSEYPNNLPLLAIDRFGAAVGSRLGMMPDSVLIGLNAVALLVSIWLAHAVVRRCAGPVAAALAALLITALVGLSPWMAVPYTDVFAMPFTMGAVSLAALAWSAQGLRRWLAWAAAVLCGALAYVIKTTPGVLIVAGVLVIALGLLPSGPRAAATRSGAAAARRVVRTVAVMALTVLAFIGSTAGVTSLARQATGVDPDRVHTSASAPIIWWVANGMIEIDAKTYISYGGFSRTMVDAISGRTQAEMTAYSRQFIADRWAERGLPGMVVFYANKALWNWNDGMFSAWGEGGDAQQHPYARTAVADTLMEFNGYHGRYYRTRASLAEGVWSAVVLLAGIGLLRAPFRRDLLMLALSVLGIGVFVLIFQGRSRYLLTFAPVVIALSCAVLPWARAPLPSLLRRRRAP